MTISKKTALLGVNDLKIFPITNDSASSFTTGTAIDVRASKPQEPSVFLKLTKKN